jgi:hypothetical protein
VEVSINRFQFECSSSFYPRNHVFEDLPPYVCTYPNCELHDYLFDSKDEWYKHEAQRHRVKWFCNTDYHLEYDKQEDFVKHMQTDHNTTFDEGQFTPIQDMFRQPSRSNEGTCNLCMLYSKKLKSHVSRHLQQIALFALPRANETDGSGKAECHSRSSRYAKKDGEKENKDDNNDDSQSSNASSESHRSDADQQTEDLSMPNLPDDEFETVKVPETEHQTWDDVTAKFTDAREGKSAAPPPMSLQLPAVPSPSCSIPFCRDVDFVDCGNFLSQIEEKCGQGAGRVALVGISGVG